MKNSSDSVKFTLYYESLCPDCKNFILKELYPVMQMVSEITELVLIPYGNAHVRFCFLLQIKSETLCLK